MKILILATMYPNSENANLGVFVHNQVKELINMGINITVISPIPYAPKFLGFISEKWSSYNRIPLNEVIDGIKIYHPRYIAIPKGYFKNYWYYSLFKGVHSILKKHFSNINFDLIHVHGSAPEDYAGYLLSNKIKCPYILTVHGDSVYKLYKNKSKFRKSKKAIEKANAIIGVSTKVIERINKYTNRKRNIFLVMNGFSPQKNDFITDERKDRVVILFAGNLIERKGCEILIKAFAKIHKKFSFAELIIVGDGPLLNKLKSLAESFELINVITFLGRMKHSDVMTYMKMCDIFVMPSWNEAFGVVYLEAMSLEKPVIATEGEGISDLIENGKNGLLIKSKDVDDLEDKLVLLIKDPFLRTRIGKEGYNTVKNLTWSSSVNEVLKIYEKVIAEHNSVK